MPALQLQAVHVLRDHAHVLEAALAAAALDELALRTRVRYRRDAALWKMLRHPQRQRSPAATEFENVLAVGQLRAIAVQREHRLLGLVQRFVAARKIAARIFQA